MRAANAKVSDIERVLAGIGYKKVGLLTWENDKFILTIKTNATGRVDKVHSLHKITGLGGDIDIVSNAEGAT